MNLTTMLQTFLKEHEWDINKLKGGDVFYYIQENVNTDELLVVSKEEVLKDSYINDYGELVIPDSTKTFDTLLEDDSDVAQQILKDLI